MEPLWSPVVATSGKRWQMPGPGKPQKQAKSVAIGCHRLRSTFHGKEGVDGSSPSEGSAKAPHAGFFFSDRFADYGTWGRYGALTCSETAAHARLWRMRALSTQWLHLLHGVRASPARGAPSLT